MKILISLLALGLVGISNASPLDSLFSRTKCKSNYGYLAKEGDFEQKKKELLELKRKEYACVYKYFKRKRKKPTFNFFISETRQSERKVQKFLGRNSLPFFRNFEKHFLYKEGPEGPIMYGYNKTKMMKLAGPGLFKVKFSEGSRKKVIIDYRGDFKKLLTTRDLKQWNGVEIEKIKNNKRNMVYGNLIDEMYFISPNMAIGAGYKMKKKGRAKKPMSYFILVRKP